MAPTWTRTHRLFSLALIAAHVATSVPVSARAPRPEGEAAATPAPALPAVTVNRTVPVVSPPSATPVFSKRPTAHEIFRARVFEEPIVPVGGMPSTAENTALAGAIVRFHRSGGMDARAVFGGFLGRYPRSSWRASLLANIGVADARAHAYSRAFDALDEAWRLSRDLSDARGRAVADFAVAAWLELAASFGQVEAVDARLAAIGGRDVSGAAGVKIARARETIGLIRRYPTRARWCGPEALMAFAAARDGAAAPVPSALTQYRGTSAGMTLAELADLADRAGLGLRMSRRQGGAIPVPSIAHLAVGHYVAVVEADGDRYRVVDRARLEAYWIDRETLLAEASGYFLVPEGYREERLSSVTDSQARTTRGSGPLCPDGSPPPAPPCKKPKCCNPGGSPPGGPPPGCGGGSCGMATYQFDEVNASLMVQDTPAGYTPPRGPAVALAFGYHHREALQPQIFSMANVGPKWTFTWLRFVQEVPMSEFGTMPAHVWAYQPPGSREVYSAPDAQGVYSAHWSSRAVLARVSSSPLRYERRLPDGAVEIYGQADGGPAGQQRVLLTEFVDPLGERLTFTWDAQLRLVGITDAVGQVTTIAYGDADPLKITSVTDPFGRTATLTYNGAGQLETITDVIGLVSRFGYGSNDFLSTLATPYGTTSFRHEPYTINHLNFRFIEGTDPLGATEHLRFEYETSSLAATAPAGEVAAGFEAWNTNLNRFNTFYWDKRAWAHHPEDLSKAVVMHWMVAEDFAGWQKYSAPAPHSVKKPLEARVWYAYPGQTAGNEGDLSWFGEPSRVGRVLDDGTPQIVETVYNTQGSVVSRTDPLGRRTSYTYGSNGVQLLEVRQTTGTANDLLAAYANFTSSLLPQTITDAAGQATTLTYNAAGHVLTVTNAKNETTTNTYDIDGRLTAVTGPVSGATSTYTYDAYGRVRTVTDADGHSVTTDYDIFDRPIRVTYPDGTYEATTYDRLDVATLRDRAGRVTRYYYDALRRLTGTRDPAGRLVAQEWCPCGGLDALVDANGNRTSWERDLQGRVTREVRADSVTDTLYTYGPASGRLLTVTDPKDQVTTYSYVADDAMASVAYSNAQIATPGVNYTYDAVYGRLATMVDGIGTTSYTYHPAGQLGAGQLASVDGPLTDDTITYSYDELGRVTTRGINGAANTVTWAFDALGRVTSEANVLGTFTYTYDGPTARVATVSYPNGQTSSYSYFDAQGDHRLQTIHHKYPNGSTLSKFDYTYDVVGNILTWRQQADNDAVIWSYGYDAADQLVAAIKATTDLIPVILKRYGYAYDAAGNRTAEQIDDQVLSASHDNLNRLVSQQPGGPLVFSGTVSEPSAVTVQGVPATVGSDNTFRTTVPLPAGTSTVTLQAVDPSGNVASKQYEVDSLGTGRTFTYDANGNLTADGTRTFEWDARNQLVAINIGTRRIEFAYNGQRHRSRAVEKEVGAVVDVLSLISCDETQVCEVRKDSGGSLKAIELGFLDNSNTKFYARDHLGTVWAHTDSAGSSLGVYGSDPFGRQLSADENLYLPLMWAGQGFHTTLQIHSAFARYYDPAMGRWLNEDPAGTTGGLNLYVTQTIILSVTSTQLAFGRGILCSAGGTRTSASSPLSGARS